MCRHEKKKNRFFRADSICKVLILRVITCVLNPDNLKDLPSRIPDMTRMLAFESPPYPLWDNRVLFIILVTLLIVEWSLRKKYKLL